MNLSYAKYLMQKTREDYDEISEEFSVTRKTMWPELGDLDKYVKVRDKVLDVGCGNGKLFRFLMAKNISYTGLDVSSKLIRIARENFKGECVQFKTFDGLNIECSTFSALRLPAGWQGFDAIYCLATLPHLPGEELRLKFLENLRKVAKPGAKIIITCWNLWQARFIRRQIDMVSNLIIDKALGKDLYDWGDLYIPWHKQSGKIVSRYYHAFTVSELNSILKKAGWEVEELGYKARYGKRNFNLFAVARRPMAERHEGIPL